MREALALTILNNLAEIEEVAASLAEPGKRHPEGIRALGEEGPDLCAPQHLQLFVQTPVFDLRNLPAVGVLLPTH